MAEAIQGVPDTAILVAAYRARETGRAAPLFRDPLAARLAGERGERILAGLPRRAFMGGWAVVIRTCIIDDLVRAAVADGADAVLNLGAGLDTRPYRLDLPPTLRWIEADFPDVVDRKRAALAAEAPRCRLARAGLDLSDGAARRKLLAGVAADSRRVLVLTEGVIPYLAPGDVAKLARDLRGHDAYRGWVVDYFSKAAYRYRRRKGMGLEKAPFRFEPDDFEAFFRRHGWRPATTRYIPEEAEKLGRPPPVSWPIRLWLKTLKRLLPAEKTRPMKQFMGYVVLEPGSPEPAGYD